MSSTWWEQLKRIFRNYMSKELRVHRFEEIGLNMGKAGEQYNRQEIAEFLRTVDKENVERYLKAFGYGFNKGYKEFTKEFLEKHDQNTSKELGWKRYRSR